MNRLSKSFAWPFQFVLLIWLIFFFEVMTGTSLAFLGILPRTIPGLIGIVFAPLIHGSPAHLFSNSIPLLILGTTLFFFFPRAAVRVFLLSYLGSGIIVWIFGRASIHIGASGLLYGIAFFLFFIGFFRKNMRSLVISLIAVFLYGGIIYGVLPGQEMVSWESHLGGAIVGFCCAFYFRRPKASRGW